MIAAVSTWHADHRPASDEIHERLSRGETMVVAAHALVESYAVLTRLPQSRRLSAADAWAILEASFARTEIVSLDSAAYLHLLRDSVARAVAGGQVYDSLIAACARAAGVDALLTFNARHFERHAGPDLSIVVPGSA